MLPVRAPTSVLAVLFCLSAFSGCIAGDPPAKAQAGDQAAKPAAFDDATGGIEGTVTDEELNAIAGAQLGLEGTEHLAASDQDGRFSFSNVEPGTYNLMATALGYHAGAVPLEVIAGEAVTIDIALTPLTSQEPYSVLQSQQGLFGCGASWRPAVMYSGVSACGVLSLLLNLTQYDKFLLEWQIDEPTAAWQGNVFEMRWTSNQIAAKGLSVNWEIEGCSNVRELTFSRANGMSPVRSVANLSVTQGVLGNLTTGAYESCSEPLDGTCGDEFCRLQSRVFSRPGTLGDSAPADVGITTQQPFEQFFTAFFHEPPTPDYTALPPE